MAQSALSQQSSLYFQRVRTLYEKPEIKASLEVILSVFAVSVLAFFAIRPTITNIFVLQKKIEDQEVLLTKANNKMSQLFAAEERLNQPDFDSQLYKNAVPDGFSYTDILTRIEKIAVESGVTLDSLSLPGDKLVGQGKSGLEKDLNVTIDDGKGHKLIPIGFAITGQQSSILSFIQALEKMDRVGIVKNFSITKSKKALGQVASTITATGEVTFYSLNK